MKTLPIIKKFYDAMTSTTKRNQKKAILSQWKDCKEVMDLLKIVYDPMITFGVTADRLSGKVSSSFHTPTDDCNLQKLMSDLADRTLSGNTAISTCAEFINGSGGEFKSLLLSIFDKDMKLGIDTATINEVFPGFIPVFEVTLAQDINKSPTYQKRVEAEKYLITRKLDGVRCITIITDDCIKCYSRLGNEFTSLNRIKEALSIAPTLKGYVLDGELCVIDADGKEDFKQAVSQIKRKDYTMETAHYKVFDILTLDEFNGKVNSSDYSVRLAKAKELLGSISSPFLSVLGAINYSADNLAKALQIVDQKGYEGLILRADAPYRSGRTSDLLKVKKFQSAEYVIEDFIKTTKQMKGLSGVMEAVECLGAVLIRHKGNPVAVGSGFSDAQRIDMWSRQEDYLGRQITVKYFEESKDADGNPSLRFPIFVDFRNEII